MGRFGRNAGEDTDSDMPDLLRGVDSSSGSDVSDGPEDGQPPLGNPRRGSDRTRSEQFMRERRRARLEEVQRARDETGILPPGGPPLSFGQALNALRGMGNRGPNYEAEVKGGESEREREGERENERDRERGRERERDIEREEGRKEGRKRKCVCVCVCVCTRDGVRVLVGGQGCVLQQSSGQYACVVVCVCVAGPHPPPPTSTPTIHY